MEGSTQDRFTDLNSWIDLAQILERGKFDSLFFADVLGMYGPYKGNWRQHVKEGLQFPIHDPAAIASAIAHATDNLGIVFTSSVFQEHPFTFARKVSTLDHLSGGRIGWNIVSGFLSNAFGNYGISEELKSGEARYELAEEYAEVVYKLWEGSWDDGAVLANRREGEYADPSKVHKIHHEGKHFRVEGPHLSPPSPQRTPLLFQAGMSEQGQAFAARHAEVLLINSASREYAKTVIDSTRARARQSGRNIKVLQVIRAIVGSTEAEARAKADELDALYDPESAAAHFGGAGGIDLGEYGLNTPLNRFSDDAGSGGGVLKSLIESAGGGDVTFADYLKWNNETTRVVGTPEQIVDELERWQDVGIDGFNVAEVVRPKNYEDFVDYVIPELQRRGLAQVEYSEGSLRKKVLGNSDYIDNNHAARGWRGRFNDPNFNLI